MYSLVLRPLPLLPSVCNHNNIRKWKQGRPGRQTDNNDRRTMTTAMTDGHDRDHFTPCG